MAMNRGFLAGLSAAIIAVSSAVPASAATESHVLTGTIFEAPDSAGQHINAPLLARSEASSDIRHAAHGSHSSHSSHSSHASHASHASHFSSAGTGAGSGVGSGVGAGSGGSGFTLPETPVTKCVKPALQSFAFNTMLDVFIVNWDPTYVYTATASLGKVRLTASEVVVSSLKRKTSVKVTVTASAPNCLPTSTVVTLKTK